MLFINVLLLLVREEDSHRLVSASDKALCQRSALTVVTNAYASSPRLVVWCLALGGLKLIVVRGEEELCVGLVRSALGGKDLMVCGRGDL
ncbi:hypothetical protein F2Q69_00038926 [Brassica cretica]|uniref:Uncharacterized protein n=1 Tax=Brassica cretica TaxID=69181 RepID=A0A8S9SNN4_BRACR|nr:hypothetical protein F2Q69_00038926 [Brassica cretica]